MSEPLEQKQIEEIDVPTEVKNIIEALIFASDDPVTPRFIRSIVDDINKNAAPEDQLTIDADSIKKAVADLNRGYGRSGSSFRILAIAGGYVFATQEQYSTWVGKLIKEKARRRLSATAVETLAIIAYKQPITKSEVEFVRGVNVDYIMRTLLEKDMIYITGRAHTPGRPLLYGTTQKFLEHFGLNDLADLPKPREIEELIGETEAEVDKRLLAEQQQLEFKEELEEKMEGHEGSKQRPKDVKREKQNAKLNKKGIEEAREEQAASLQTGVPNTEGEASDDSATESRAAEAASDNGSTQAEENPIKVFSEKGLELSKTTGQVESEEQPQQATSQHEEHPADTAKEIPLSGDESPDGETDRENFIPNRDHDREAGQSGKAEDGSGWSKWKNKVKSFFRKIFG